MRFIFRMECAPSAAHVREPRGHKRDCDYKAEQEVDKHGERPGIEKNIRERSEDEDNERRAAASEQDFAPPMFRQSITNTALQRNPRSGKL